MHVAAAGRLSLPYVDKKFPINIQRSPFAKRNMAAYKELKTIINHNDYEIIHCHTPMGGVLGRLAARKARKNGTKVIYTAHGFHFCKGAPLLNWFLYYPIEKILARHTDCLITINQEDFDLAVKRRFRARRIERVHGVGVDTEQFTPVDPAVKHHLREAYDYRQDDFLMFYAAEFNKNKNQQLLIKALALVKNEVPNARLLLAGNGALLESCRKLASQLGVDQMVDFLGYRDDVEKLLKQCDLAVASSFREGLPVNIMEAMACGLPVVASENRGHIELIREGENGWIVNNHFAHEMAERITYLARHIDRKNSAGMTGRTIMKDRFSVEKVLAEKSLIYASFTDRTGELKWTYQ